MNTAEDAANALDNFAEGPALDAAEDIAKAFEMAGDRISLALERAARSGEFSFNSLAESVTRDLARLAITELLVNVNMSVSGVSDAQSFTKSQGQISSALARAVSEGQRYI